MSTLVVASPSEHLVETPGRHRTVDEVICRVQGAAGERQGGKPKVDPNCESRRTRRCDRGFTLVELLIVIAILGIMATVTVFSVRGISGRGKLQSCQADRKVLAAAAEAYFAMNGVLEIPATGTGDDRYERTLLDAGLIRAMSDRHNVLATGRVVLQQTAVNPDGTTQAFCEPPPLAP